MKKKRLIGGLLVAGMTLASGIVIGTANTKAVDFSSTETYVSVGEIWDNETKSFNQDNMRILMKYITGDENATIDDIKTLSATPQKSSAMRTKELSAGVEGDTGYTKKSSTQNINVWLGGLEWQVTYLSQDKSGNPILTLWLSNSTQEAFKDRAQDEGTHYGYYEGGLYSDWSNNWSSGTTTSAYPSAMYGTSYVRAVTLNNGGQYALNNTTLSEAYAQSESSAFALFTMDEFGLTDYLVTPANVSWQENQLTKTQYGFSYNLPNDGWAMNQDDTGYYNAEYNYSEKTGYDTWKDDYLWLPSMSETGWSNSSSGGLWGLNVYQRMNYDGETLTKQNMKVGTAKGEAYTYSFLRSGHLSSAGSAYFLYPSGSYSSSRFVDYSRSIRPSLHLNLSSAVPSTAPREITFESNGGTSVGSKIYYNGQKYLNLPTPTYEGKYFAGWYLDSSLTQPVTGSTVVSLDTTSATLYAKWEESGYTINYNLNGGNSSVTMPTAVASGGEFNLQSPTRFGYIFKGWSLGEGTDFTTAYTGTEGATALATEGDIILHPSGGSVYFKNLTQAGETVTLIANWEVDPNAKDYQVLTYNEYFTDNNITKDTMNIHTISSATELDEHERDNYMEYDLVICGNTYYYINTTEGFMYLMNYSLSGISLTNKYLELNCDVYINDETYDENGAPTTGDRTVYQYNPPASGSGMSFDGNGHTIYGMYVNNPERANFALFYCGSSTVQKIENLYVSNFFVKIASTGAIVAYNVNTISNCETMNGYFICAGGYCGGIVYSPRKLISGCVNNIDIKGSNQTSGITYITSNNLVLEDCTNYGDVTGAWAVAGVVSYPSGSNLTFKNCDNYGDITGTSHTSGILGIWYGKNAQFVDCDNHGKISGGQAAGFLGYVEGRFDFYNCTNTGWTNGAAFVNTIVTVNIKNSEQCYNFTNCRAVLKNNIPLVSGGSPTYATTLKMKNIDVDIDFAGSYSRNILLQSKNTNISCEYENISISGKTNAYSGTIAAGTGSFKNIMLDLSVSSLTTRSNYINNSNASLLMAENIIIDIYNRTSLNETKQYYGSDFSAFNISWKTGAISLNALSGKGFFQNTLTEDMLIARNYTKKTI